MEMPGGGRHRDSCPGLTVSFSAQSVVGVTLIANQVLHVAVCNLRGLWAAVICKEKQEEEVNIQKLLPKTHKKIRGSCCACQPPYTPDGSQGMGSLISGWLPSALHSIETAEIRMRRGDLGLPEERVQI